MRCCKGNTFKLAYICIKFDPSKNGVNNSTPWFQFKIPVFEKDIPTFQALDIWISGYLDIQKSNFLGCKL